MTIVRMLGFTGLTAIVLAIAAQHLAIGYFLVSLLPTVLAASYVRSLVRIHNIAAISFMFVALIPLYVSSTGPLNALLAVRSSRGYQTPILDDAMLVIYRPLNLLPWSSPDFAISFERYLDEWSEIGHSLCVGSVTYEFDPASGVPLT